jgi:hypothetical protein
MTTFRSLISSRRFRRRTAVCAALGVAIALAANPTPSRAQTVVFSGAGATAIDNLVIDGSTYDILFVEDGTAGASADTFIGNQSDATAAANAINSALNGADAQMIGLQLGEGSSIVYGVLYETATCVESLFQNNDWTAVGENGVDGGSDVAEFTPVGAPEPASLSLFAAALAGLAGVRRRRRRAG